jgi:hypothetical protein|tara:strand:- start:111 stop:287 length:177 start_codon:yes stop_codon:yes gene_type:complete
MNMAKKYIVRIYFTKFVDVEVEAENKDEALESYELPYLDWYDGNDTAEQPHETEVTEG